MTSSQANSTHDQETLCIGLWLGPNFPKLLKLLRQQVQLESLEQEIPFTSLLIPQGFSLSHV